MDIQTTQDHIEPRKGRGKLILQFLKGSKGFFIICMLIHKSRVFNIKFLIKTVHDCFIFCRILRQKDLHDESYYEYTGYHVARENLTEDGRHVIEEAFYLSNAYAEADSSRSNQRVTVVKTCFDHHLDSRHHDRTEHDYGASAEYAIRQCCQECSDRREKSAEDHRQRSEHDTESVYNMSHGDKSNILAE